jgi:hypothetical protein
MVLIGLLVAMWLGAGEPSVVAAMPSPTPSPAPSMTQAPTDTPTPSQTPMPTDTPAPSVTPTASPTPTLVPVLALIHGSGGKGVFLRDKPSGKTLRSLLDGEMVSVLGYPVFQNGLEWLQVRTSDGTVGWVAMEFCATVTPTISR